MIGSIQPKRLLLDARMVRFQLTEDAARPGRVILRGEVAHSKKPTQNKRLYPGPLWVESIKRLNESMQNKSLYGELDHPEDGKTKFSRVSHFLTGLSLQEDGAVLGELEVIPTPTGKILIEILRAGGAVGVSSRGYGSTRPTDLGYEEVCEDYNLMTLDVVVDPADSTAYPKAVFEGYVPSAPVIQEKQIDMNDRQKFEEAVAQERERIKTELTAHFSKLYTEELAKIRIEAKTQVPKDNVDLSSLPASVVEDLKKALQPLIPMEEAVQQKVDALHEEVDALRGLVLSRDALLREEVAVQEGLQAQIVSLQEENNKLGRIAITTGLRFFIEQQLANDPEESAIRKMLGSVAQYENAEQLKAKLDEIRGGLTETRKQREAIQNKYEKKLKEMNESVQAERTRAAQEAKQLRAEQNKLTKLVEEALQGQKALIEENRKLQLQLHIESQTSGLPHGPTARKVLGRANVQTAEQADEIIEELKPRPARHPLAEQGRDRVARYYRGQSETPTDEETPEPNYRAERSKSLTEGYNGTGLEVDEFADLTGIRF